MSIELSQPVVKLGVETKAQSLVNHAHEVRDCYFWLMMRGFDPKDIDYGMPEFGTANRKFRDLMDKDTYETIQVVDYLNRLSYPQEPQKWIRIFSKRMNYSGRPNPPEPLLRDREALREFRASFRQGMEEDLSEMVFEPETSSPEIVLIDNSALNPIPIFPLEEPA